MRLIPIVVIAALVSAISLACIEKRPQQTLPPVSRVTRTLEEMVREDMAMRDNDSLDWSIVAEADLERRRNVYELLANGTIEDPQDLWKAALILQHADPGSCTECYLLAHYLSLEAVNRGMEEARYMVALNLDRYLVFSGQPQKYGTQYNSDSTGMVYLYPVDPATTDADREMWDVPTFEEISHSIDSMNNR